MCIYLYISYKINSFINNIPIYIYIYIYIEEFKIFIIIIVDYI